MLKLKQFKERKSIFTELSESKHFITLKHIFYGLLLACVIKDLVYSLVLNRKVDYGLRPLLGGFSKFHLLLLLWFVLFTENLIAFYLFNLWAKFRIKYMNYASVKWLLDCLFLCLIMVYYVKGFYLTPTWVKTMELPILSGGSLLAEQVRMLMKTHAFVRYNAPNVISYKPHSDKRLLLPSLKHYVYFFFAPTILYRHEYPRNKSINWTVVINCFMELLLCIWIASYTMDIFFINKLENFDVNKDDWNLLMVVSLEGAIGGFIINAVTFYLLQHSWLNGFAEMLRFADRKFYDDWWTATNSRIFFRKWNWTVQDWLYEYVYKEFYETITPKSKITSKTMVFLISAVVHELIIIAVLQLFLPCQFFCFFVLGMISSFINTKSSFCNVLLWCAFSFGYSFIITLYTAEVFANRNSPILDYNTTTSYYIPRIFSAWAIK